jgi:hypothetical protein
VETAVSTLKMFGRLVLGLLGGRKDAPAADEVADVCISAEGVNLVVDGVRGRSLTIFARISAIAASASARVGGLSTRPRRGRERAVRNRRRP